MKTVSIDSASRLATYALIAFAAWYVIIYVLLASLRLSYPFEIEPLESACVHQVRRILSGQALYVRPSLEFVPFVYAPLYFYLSAAVATLFGIDFFPLRLVSFVSSAGSLTVIFLFSRRETGNVFAAFLASGLFAATFYISASWFDIARVDSLFLFLLLLGIYLVRFGTSRVSQAIAGVLFVASFLTKQTALFIASPILLYYAWRGDKQRVSWAIATAVVGIIGSTWYFDHISSGWYTYYVFRLPTQSGIRPGMLLGFWMDNMLSWLPIALAIIGYSFYQSFRSGILDGFHVVLAASMIGASWAGRINQGGYKNASFPAYAAVAILFGCATDHVLKRLAELPREVRARRQMLLLFLCLGQFALLYYDPLSPLPRARDRMFGEALVKDIGRIEGDVFIPGHGAYAVAASKKSYAAEWAIRDVMSDTGDIREALLQEIREAIRSRKFGAIVLDCSQHGELFGERIEEYYRESASNCVGDPAKRPKPFVETYTPTTGVVAP